MSQENSRKRSRSAVSHCSNPASPTDRPSISSPPASWAASRSSISSVEPAALSTSLASIHADPRAQATASLLARIDDDAFSPRALFSSDSVCRRLARLVLVALAPQQPGKDASGHLIAFSQREIPQQGPSLLGG